MGFLKKLLKPTIGDDAEIYQWRSTKWFIQLTVGMNVFTDIFLYALIVPVMPFSLKSRLHMENEKDIQSWVSILIAVYGGALALVSPLCGWAADHSSNRRMPLIFGLFAMAGATILLHLGPNIIILVLGRILQGVSAAVVWVVGLAIIVDTVAPSEIGQSMGLVFFAMSIGVLVGPLLGGFVFEKAGYNAVFAMAYALLAVDVILRVLMVEKKWVRPEDKDKDTSSIAESGRETPNGELSAELAKISPELDKKERSSVNSKETKVTPTAGASQDSLIILPKKKKTGQAAILILLRSRRMLSCLWGVMVSAVLMAQFDSVLPIHVKETFNWDATAAGLIFLPITLTAFLSPVVGWGVDKYGPRWFTVAGFATLAPFEVLLMLVTKNTLGQKVVLCVLLSLIGISFDLTIPPLLVEVTGIIEDKDNKDPGCFGERGAMAQAYGLFNLAWAMGALIGPIWAGFVNEHDGWSTMCWSLALISGVTVVPAAIWTGGSIFDPVKRNLFSKKREEKLKPDNATDC